MKKAFYNRFCAFATALLISVLSVGGVFVEYNSLPVYADDNAAAELLEKLTNYVFTYIGAVHREGEGLKQVAKIPSEIYNTVKNHISQALGTDDLYVDDDGNYVFSNNLTKQIYDSLSSQNGYNARVISDFSGFFNYAVTSYVSNQFIGMAEQCKEAVAGNGAYLYLFKCGALSNVLNYEFRSWDISSVAYFAVDEWTSRGERGQTIKFYGSDGKNVSVPYAYVTGSYYTGTAYMHSEGDITTMDNIATGSDTGITVYPDKLYQCDDTYTYFPNMGSFFPVYNSKFAVSYSFYSNHSLVLAQSVSDGTVYNNTKETVQYIYNNDYTVIQPISQDKIINNDWTKIYNDFVVNVDTENDGGTDLDELRKIIKNNVTALLEALEKGIDDLGDEVEKTNDWLKKCYERLGEIKDLLEKDGGVIDDLDGIKSTLELIETELTNVHADMNDNSTELLNRLQSEYVLLNDIYTTLLAIKNGQDRPHGEPLIDPGDITDLTNLGIEELLRSLTPWDAVLAVMQNIFPFCLVPMMGALINDLSADPVPPDIKIPFKISNIAGSNMSVNETVNMNFIDDSETGIDFTIVHDIWIAAFMIVFIIGLIWLSFWLIEKVLNIMG